MTVAVFLKMADHIRDIFLHFPGIETDGFQTVFKTVFRIESFHQEGTADLGTFQSEERFREIDAERPQIFEALIGFIADIVIPEDDHIFNDFLIDRTG